MDKNIKLFVDSDNCIWCGACIAICPEVFKFNDEWKSIPYNQPKNSQEKSSCIDATDWCPVWVIHIENI